MSLDYDERKVDRWEDGQGVIVSTAWTQDGLKPFETAIRHPEFNSGHIMPVAAYDTREDAVMGHGEWVSKVINGLGDSVQGVVNNWVAEKLRDEFGMKLLYRRGAKEME